MIATLSIIRYPTKYIPFALAAMAIFRTQLFRNKNISFYKLMGCGKNGTFDIKPDLNQWAIFSVHKTVNDLTNQNLYGTFIAKWFNFFKCEVYTLGLDPTEGHGKWDGKELFGALPVKTEDTGVVAVLTRATIRISRLKHFWRHVAPVASKMVNAKGFLLSFGIGEAPWIKQATFSIWQNKADMKSFAYQMKEHTDVIRKTKEQKWYSEDMYVRFKIFGILGTLHGTNPLEGKL